MIDVNDIMSKLTLEEKICLLSGHKSWHTVKVPRVGLPAIFLTDGPHGLRKKKEDDKIVGLGQTELSTCFPAACSTGSSWNKDLLYAMGVAMGEECRYYNVNLILGPAVNIKRNPLCGRNFEYFSEDPLIAGQLGAKLTRGIEDMKVGTSVKHFACNNNEKNRYFGDSIVDERALREIYLKAFEPIIKEGKPQTVMCAYNKVNGRYASENPKLLNQVLRQEWGFEGLVMSDWGAVNDRVSGLNSGLDLEMPGDIAHNRKAIYDALNDGSLSIDVLDESVRRVLNMINNTTAATEAIPEKFEEHAELARFISEDSAVLLKNDNATLPISEGKRYLVIGDMFENMRYQGAGSSLLRPYKLTSPKMAFDAHGVDYIYERGYDLNMFEENTKLAEKAYLKSKYADVDAILFFGGLSEYAESEGFDRTTLSLPENQVKLLERVAQSDKPLVFVMYGGSPVDMSFESKVDAILNMYLPGEEGGEATYDLLFGNVSPSGRLCETWPMSYDDVPFGSEFTKTTNDRYKESIFVGYRYYSSFNVPVRYPFGYGLSYTSFEYSNMRVKKDREVYRVYVDVKNTGAMAGAHVVELFVEAPKTNVVKPLRELRDFKKVYLEAGEEATISLKVKSDDLRYYINDEWVLENGAYDFQICSDVNTVAISHVVNIKHGVDEIVDKPVYAELYGCEKEQFLAMEDESFDKLLDRVIPSPEVKRPYNLNTPICEYETWGGNLIYNTITKTFKRIYKKELKGKNTPDKQTKVKNAYFGWKIMETMSLRSMSYASEGLLPHHVACALCDISNNRIFHAIGKLIVGEKCIKLPDQGDKKRKEKAPKKLSEKAQKKADAKAQKKVAKQAVKDQENAAKKAAKDQKKAAKQAAKDQKSAMKAQKKAAALEKKAQQKAEKLAKKEAKNNDQTAE